MPFVAIVVLASLPFIVPNSVQAQNILFEDNFEKRAPLDGTGKWHVARGKWVLQRGRLVSQGRGKSLILVTDKHWDEAWRDYWFYSTINFNGLSPLIFWRFHSDGSQGGEFTPAGDLPKRMAASGRRHVIYWWFNKEGSRSVVQRDVRTIVKEFEKTKTRTLLNGGTDYWVKIENQQKSYTLYLTENGAAAASGDYGAPIVDFTKDANNQGEGRIGFGTINATIQVDNVFVTQPGINPLAVEAQGKLAATWGMLKSNRLR